MKTGLRNELMQLIRGNLSAATSVVRKSTATKGLGRIKSRDGSPVQVLTFEETLQKFSGNISEEEIQAWVWYRRKIGVPMKGWNRYYITDNQAQALAKKGFLFFDDNQLLPYPVYTYGNMYDRELNLKRDAQYIISTYGQKAYDAHVEAIKAAKPPVISILNPDPRERPKILSISKFASEFMVGSIRREFRLRKSGELSIKSYFSDYLEMLPKEEFESVTAAQIWNYYVLGGRIPKYYSEEQRGLINNNAPKEGERLFAKYLHEALHIEDQQKLDLLWNRTFNGQSSINYQRVPVGFECSATFKLNDLQPTAIQLEGVSFCNIVGAGVLGYDVGVGKTMTAILTLANEMYSGKCTRPIVVVPNQTYAKWIKEIFGYEDDKTGKFVAGILSGTGIKLNDWHNLGSDKLRQLEQQKKIKKINEYYWEFKPIEANTITILTYEGFARMGFGKNVSEELIEELIEILAQVDEDEKKSRRDEAKELEQIKALVEVGNKGTICDIDELKADYLVVDEAHNFKNVFSYVPTDKNGNKRFSIEASDSARGKKLFLISNYIQRTFGENVLCLTATPFTNNPIEIYSVLATVSYKTLVKNNIKNLYSFLEAFVQQEYEYVNNYDGTIVEKPVVKSFNNRIVLQRYINNAINYKTGEEAGVKRPVKINLPRTTKLLPDGRTTRLPLSEQIPTYLAMTQEQRLAQIRINRLAQTGKSNTEKLANVMKALALSLDNALSHHLAEGTSPQSAKGFIESSPKLEYVMRCIDSVKKWHESRGESVSGQVIYINRGKEYFPFIKEYLESEVGFGNRIRIQTSEGKYAYIDEVEILTSATPQDRREVIKEAFLDGTCKVIIGTATIREGIDLQRKGTVLYNCYPDWNPTDQKQLEGRIHRQGNDFAYVRIVMPLVQDSMDVFVFQKLEEKTARVNDLWAKANRGNVLDVESLDPEEVKFALYTDLDELLKIKREAEAKVISRDINAVGTDLDALKKTLSALDGVEHTRSQLLLEIQNWKVNLQLFETYVPITPWLSTMSKSELDAVRELVNSRLRDIESFLTKVPQNDIDLIDLWVSVKDTRLNWNGYLKISKITWDSFKEAVSLIAKAKRTILENFGVGDSVSEVQKVIDELEGRRVRLIEKINYLRSAEYEADAKAEIQRKKDELRVDGQKPVNAVKDFERLNYLLGFKYDKDNPPADELPSTTNTTTTNTTTGNTGAKLALARLKMLKAKAKLKIKIATALNN